MPGEDNAVDRLGREHGKLIHDAVKKHPTLGGLTRRAENVVNTIDEAAERAGAHARRIADRVIHYVRYRR